MKTFCLFIILITICCLISLAYSLDPESCKCRVPTHQRIINGHRTKLNEYPWMVSIQTSDNLPMRMRKLMPSKFKIDRHFCGGVIINEYWVLTAAHCVANKKLGDFRIGYGDNDLVRIYDNDKYKEVNHFFTHVAFEWKPDGLIYDIALIKVKTPFVFDENTQPACLENKTVELYPNALQVSGWGSIAKLRGSIFIGKERAVLSRWLKVGDTYDYSNTSDVCREVISQNICTDSIKTLDAACDGDSGGPLHHRSNGKTSVVGLVSWGPFYFLDYVNYIACTGPDVYLRVNYFINWIKYHALEICT